MPWPRNDRDPLEAMRRKLAEEEQRLAAEMARLAQELNGDSAHVDVKPVEPPIWRMEEDGMSPHRIAEPTPARKRNLARQRQRDMILFFTLLGVLIVVLVIVIWVAYVRNTAPNNGA